MCKILFIALVSCIALAAYNSYAFGKASGPYQQGALEISTTSLMVLFGLLFDQNQGFLFQNPIYFIGLISIGALFRYNRFLAMLLVIVFLSLLVPNALHPNWYGGTSFTGRFGWSATIVFMIPTIYGLLKLADAKEKLWRVIVSVCILLQIYFFYWYAIADVSLYNHMASTWIDSYSIFFYPIHYWLPMLYHPGWAYGYTPNYAWLIFFIGLITLGLLPINKARALMPCALIALVAIIVIAGAFNAQKANGIVFQGNDLPSDTGRINGTRRVATPGVDSQGYVNFGPYVPLRKGRYSLKFKYSSTNPPSQAVGLFDIADSSVGFGVFNQALQGTNGAQKELRVEFDVNNWNQHVFEFRTKWDGKSEIEIHEIDLRKM